MINPLFLKRMIGIVVALVISLLFTQPLMAGGVYYTDTDNENNAGDGVPDNDMDIALGASSANHPIEFNIDVSGALPTESVVLTVRANDVDEEQGEIDEVYLNGTLLDKLTGTNETWSTTAFTVDPALIVSGNNLVRVDVATQGGGWVVRIDWAQLLIDGGAAEDGNTGNISITNVDIAAGIVTIDTQVEITAITGGNYLLELNLIDPSGNALDVISDPFSATAGTAEVRNNSTSYNLSGETGVYEIQAQLFFEDQTGFWVQQDIKTRQFYHEQNVGPSDHDSDGLHDVIDLDDDNDGIPDTLEGSGAVDTDGDGITDSLDLDSDNDGLYDLVESGAAITGLDGDNDGRIDSANAFGANGLADGLETTPDSGSVNYTLKDTDSDSTPDFRDLDSDGDGISDVVEAGGSDGDSDGVIGTGAPVVDADGLPTGGGLTPPDSNSDGTPDFQDATDTDGDGLVDSIDLDDDNDGILDSAEGSEAVDTDTDGVPDSLDLDSDNDGLYDLVESGAVITGLDGDNDGRIDSGNAFGANGMADGLETTADSGSVNYTLKDTDSDSLHDFRDLDSDNDGIPDVTEAGGSDGDSDGVIGTGAPGVDADGAPTGGGLTPPDTDSDGASDQIDLDADADGLFDLLEAGGVDADSNGLVDGFTDSNNNGLDDTLTASPLPVTDTNSDGTPDFQDSTDSDGDGVVDSIDLDDDNDGILDSAEGSEAVDTDTDGVPDSLDLDSDNDGLYDLVESGAVITGLDGDNDGRIDSANAFGANGLADGLETTPDSGSVNYTLKDTDSDSTPDFRDLDSDGDGISDVVEAGGSDGDSDGVIGTGAPVIDGAGLPAGAGLTPSDFNGDGTPDYRDGSDRDGDGVVDSLDLDLDNDGIPNTSEGDGQLDTDSDGTPDSLDLDADGDGLSDLVEAGGTDSNGDGLVDTMSDANGDGLDDGLAASPLPLTDSNSDGTPDFQDATDTDGDGLVDTLDLDDDNDGILDSAEGSGAVDSDADGVPDSLDLDSDNDGLYDLIESGASVSGLDGDSDGRIDSGNAFGSNGLVDALETTADSGSVAYTLRDSDSDAVADFRDLDSDGDGLYDTLEAGGIDADNNGLVDGFSDLDGDGLHDVLSGSPLPQPDRDADTVADYLDLDSDNDGLYDVIEAAGADSDGDGLLGSSPQTVDTHGVAPGSGLTFIDTDGDGVTDPHDLDSDNDGVPDVTENGGSDADGDGLAGAGAPVVDLHGVTSGPILPGDTNGDGTTNQLDSDADGDGLLDIVEAGGIDSDSDGRVDGFIDADGDGMDDLIAATPLSLPDSDGDGIPDFLDNDDQDNDGVPDSVDLDLDNDGIPNDLEGNGSVDTDNDGVPDSRDLDSDNDGLHDLMESGADSTALDSNGDGRIDGSWSAGANGIADVVESSADSGAVGYNGGVLRDADTDGVADFRDLDSDNDGLYDVIESGGSDPDSDGLLGSGSPGVNGEGEAPGSGLTPPDTDGDGVTEQLDLDSDNDTVPDVIEAGGSDPDGDGVTGTGAPSVDTNTGVPLLGGGLSARDTDGDGTPDFQDPDSDNDGEFDLQEAGTGGVDTNPRDGMLDTIVDSNGDGLDENLRGVALSLPDSDKDGTPDVLDSTNSASGGDEPPLQTGVNGVGGCSLGAADGVDPLLPLLVILALAYLGLGLRRNLEVRVK